jgi:pyruvate-ferredoxin/flavodoxin oxidoreductase
MQERITVDGNEAAARIAHLTNEVIAIYPITPASPMGELSDAWSSQGRKNLWGSVPQVIEMQSEGGAAGAVHGSLQAGALTTTFTASQGLLLMLPNMYKIAGELTPTVFHVAARAVASHALSIFGDHSDVMAARSTGWAMLCSNDVQEAQDFALIAQAASLQSRIPFLHFFDGFRTSHELNQIFAVDEDTVRQMLSEDAIAEFRARALTPDQPSLRGSAQNPDDFYQAREAAQPYYDAAPGIVQAAMDRFAALTGRQYKCCEYSGAEDAERVLVLMGSGCSAVEEAVAALNERGQKVGMLRVRLFRPFEVKTLVDAIPRSVTAIGVLDRTKEAGSAGEPLLQDVMTAYVRERAGSVLPKMVGARYGIGQKEFTPAMAAAILDELKNEAPKQSITVGIVDDVSGSSLAADESKFPESSKLSRALFYGLGSDGTVGASKSTVKILAKEAGLWAQGYFVYDSKKSGSVTVSHVRFGSEPIRSSYQIRKAEFVACHQFEFLSKMDVLGAAAPGGTFLLNSPFAAAEIWEHLPRKVQQQILEKELLFYTIDADTVAEGAGLGRRINTVMQACFFALNELLEKEQALAAIRHSLSVSYGHLGTTVVERNLAAVEAAVGALEQVSLEGRKLSGADDIELALADAPDFVQRVTRMLMSGMGDLLPVSAMPVDGAFPTSTARWEKRSIAHEIPIWDPDVCIQCGLCALVCPHAAIRVKAFPAAHADGLGNRLPWRDGRGKELVGNAVTIQVAPDDCTGCAVCVDVCPAVKKENVSHKAINMRPKTDHLDVERLRFATFLELPERDRTEIDSKTIKGSQQLEPLFEFSGACAGCGETPYLKLLSQLFGDRAVIANATGCSSIYGGNLPTTPWSINADGRGPAWSNSLFEDNAEFGLGMRLALDQQASFAKQLVEELAAELGKELVRELATPVSNDAKEIAARRALLERVDEKLASFGDSKAEKLRQILPSLLPRSVWIVGGDGWAYDIGFGGLDHVIASGRNVNILVLDTEVYSNTGGQASKATPLGAVAKFASGGKAIPKKDLGMIASAYGNVYVAQIAMGANPAQTVKAFHEAESFDGPSLIIAYSTCIAHGIDMSTSMSHQKEAMQTGYWPLYRYDPRVGESGKPPLQLDSRKPKKPFKAFAMQEARFAILRRSDPEASERYLRKAQENIDERWHLYEQMAKLDHGATPGERESS